MKLLHLTMIAALAATPFALATPAAAGCPPGLAKKANGCTPPGLAKKGVTGQPGTGKTFDTTGAVIVDHDRYTLAPPPAGQSYYKVGDQAYLIDDATREVLDTIALASAVLK